MKVSREGLKSGGGFVVGVFWSNWAGLSFGSSVPICFEVGSVVLIREGEWTSRYAAVASVPACLWRTDIVSMLN